MRRAMSRYTRGISSVTEDHKRSDAAPTRRKTGPGSFVRASISVKLGLSCAALLLAAAPFAAESADGIKFPSGYRSWFHVNTLVIDKASPLFDSLGGMHNVYVNSTGQAALKKGVPYPDKTVFVSDVHEFTLTDGSYVEGPRKALGIMVKDQKKYTSTGGWGFELWLGGDPKKTFVTDPVKQCFECHQPKKDQDYVYSTYIP
jgi:Cytochrome P460